jgi:hypothetical protein
MMDLLNASVKVMKRAHACVSERVSPCLRRSPATATVAAAAASPMMSSKSFGFFRGSAMVFVVVRVCLSGCMAFCLYVPHSLSLALSHVGLQCALVPTPLRVGGRWAAAAAARYSYVARKSAPFYLAKQEQVRREHKT